MASNIETIQVPANAITEHVLSGNVTLNLIMICFAVASVAVGITLWAVYRFQTKDEADIMEKRIYSDLQEERTRVDNQFASVHKHFDVMMQEWKEAGRDNLRYQDAVRTSLHQLQVTLVGQGSDISYLKAKAEVRA